MLILTESEVQELLPMDRALEAIEASFIAQHQEHGLNRSRQRILLPHCSLHYMAAALPDQHLLGLKIYTVTREAWRFVVLLFDSASGEQLALIEADHLGRIRTGAASGVATKYLARQDASRVGLIGTGRQARTQLEAVACVRTITEARVYSRREERRLEFCHDMANRLHLKVEPAESAESAAGFGDIVITATTSITPVVRGDWFRPGTHINAIGANMANRRELDDEAIARCALLTVDSLEQSKEESGDLIQAFFSRPGAWEQVMELHEIVAGDRRGRHRPGEITLFKSTGIALWDVAAAGYVYHEARRRSMGREVPFLHQPAV